MCLQETKIQEMSNVLVKNLGVGRCLEFRVLNSRGTTRGGGGGGGGGLG